MLLDDFEKGMTAARLDEIFSQVRQQNNENAAAPAPPLVACATPALAFGPRCPPAGLPTPRAACPPPSKLASCRLQVKAGLVPLLADLRSRGKAPSDAWLKGDYDTKKQAE